MLVATENIACVNIVFNIVKAGIIAIGDNGVEHLLELVEIIDNKGAEESFAIIQGGFVDDDVGAFGLHKLHDALDRRLAEVVGIGLHGEAEEADGDGFSVAGILFVDGIVVPACFVEDGIGGVVFASAVGLYDSGHHTPSRSFFLSINSAQTFAMDKSQTQCLYFELFSTGW